MSACTFFCASHGVCVYSGCFGPFQLFDRRRPLSASWSPQETVCLPCPAAASCGRLFLPYRGRAPPYPAARMLRTTQMYSTPPMTSTIWTSPPLIPSISSSSHASRTAEAALRSPGRRRVCHSLTPTHRTRSSSTRASWSTRVDAVSRALCTTRRCCTRGRAHSLIWMCAWGSSRTWSCASTSPMSSPTHASSATTTPTQTPRVE